MGKIKLTHVLDFLSTMFHNGHNYSTINTPKGTAATIVLIPPYNSLNKH